jgi:5-methylcytosine-specific restriction protein B
MSTDAPSSLLNQGAFGYAYRRLPGANAKATATATSVSDKPLSLNTILYGPPGTSKTYETINHALKIIEPTFAAANVGNRNVLKKRFDELGREGRIEFLTFHQSYSYEDFVEGIKASTEGGVISYQVEDGVFKRFCIRARVTASDDQFQQALDAFKFSLADEPVELKTKRGEVFTIWWSGGSTFRVRPHASAPNADYAVSIENVARRYRGESESDMYNLSYVRAVLAHVTEKWHIKPFKEASVRQRYVMIIDEINRGNIASIFGELITLIEPSKRHGQDEELTATLPYSKVPGGFSVPDNLFIIGTMNTADRSLSRIDTALRRRFEFVPMYPRPELLDGVMVDDIDVGALLRAMNERIELLYDRDHLLGHAFFMSLADRTDKPELAELAAIFRNRVIPLLEEYFFDDWEQIRLVLADDAKASTDFQFVLAEDGAAAFAGKGEAGGSKTAQIRFRRNDEALMRTESYRQTYAP